MHLTKELVSRVPPFEGESGKLSSRDDLPTDVDYAGAVEELLAGAPPSGEVWIFAYGSLIWSPEFDFVEERLGTLAGYRRSFCLGWVRIYRGTPERPGIMLGLESGGSCRGVAFRLPNVTLRENLERVVRREHPIQWEKLHMKWADVRTDSGPIRALIVVLDTSHPAYLPDLAEDVIVEALATAAGERGSMAEYLRSTVEHLEDRGIHDGYLWKMQKLVAARLSR
ncbi:MULTISPECIES: gamma-glutamylcyclotransferase [Falsihalocynthiibacter]|uniref:gamma-glutamylcyclotransferase n=1 Tax=Falsihalocynthiibacter TaxID=2854182 RepID=UPI00300208D0